MPTTRKLRSLYQRDKITKNNVYDSILIVRAKFNQHIMALKSKFHGPKTART